MRTASFVPHIASVWGAVFAYSRSVLAKKETSTPERNELTAAEYFAVTAAATLGVAFVVYRFIFRTTEQQNSSEARKKDQSPLLGKYDEQLARDREAEEAAVKELQEFESKANEAARDKKADGEGTTDLAVEADTLEKATEQAAQQMVNEEAALTTAAEAAAAGPEGVVSEEPTAEEAAAAGPEGVVSEEPTAEEAAAAGPEGVVSEEPTAEEAARRAAEEAETERLRLLAEEEENRKAAEAEAAVKAAEKEAEKKRKEDEKKKQEEDDLARIKKKSPVKEKKPLPNFDLPKKT